MTKRQRELIASIESIKTDLRTAKGDERQRLQAQAKKLAHWLTEDDNREPELKRRKNDPGGRSRSASFGRWHNDDERQIS
jgi:hypothetical protein